MSKFDELLILLGTGRWNLVTFFAAGYWMIQVPCQSVGGAFLTPEVDHSCRLPPEATNVSEVSQCKYNVTTSVGSFEERPCLQWDFDNTTYTNTLTSEFQLVCEYRFLRPAFKSLYFFGAFVGAPLNGWLSDKYGRKTMLVVGTLTYSVLANAVSWLHNISVILLARFCLGLMHPTSIHSAFSLAMEICVPRYRSFVGILVFLPWSLSVIALGGYGYLLRDWRWLMFTVCLPSLLFLPALWFIDESPRWLIVKGRHQEALRVLRRAAKWNKVKLPHDEELLTVMAEIQKEQEDGRSQGRASSSALVDHLRSAGNELIILFKTRRIRTLTLYLYVNYVVAGLVYYGLSLGGDKFGVDPFVYMSLSGAMEIPGSTLTIPMVDRMGRRPSNAICFFVTAAVLLVLGVIPTGIDWLVTTMALLGKLTIAAAYQVLSLQATELFPTEVRLRGLGTCSMMSKIGSISAPFLVEALGTIGSWAPLVLFGAAGFVAGVVTLRLPETRGTLMQDTVAGLEASGKTVKEKSAPLAQQEQYLEEKETLT